MARSAVVRSFAIAGVLVALMVAVVWLKGRDGELPPGFAAGNGRLEATEVDVASKVAGRLASVDPKEGEMVVAGAEVARLDADELNAQLRAVRAQSVQTRKSADESRAGVRKSQTDVELAGKTLKRSEELVGKGFITRDKLDRDQSGMAGAMAGMAQAQSKVAESDAAVAASDAKLQSLMATLQDTALRAPINGRVLYRLMEPGEVVGAGGKVLTLVDLTDMFVSIYLPAEQAGKVALAGEARIVLDALPDQPIPAVVSFVAPKAQFTPREVETKSERAKLMFRVKVRADPAWLAAHADLAKAGMPGVAYVRLDAAQPWPARLQLR